MLARTASVLAIAALLGAGLVGCSSTPGASTTPTDGSSQSSANEAPARVDLTGTWKQTNSQSADSYQSATITGDLIEIYWVSDGGDTRSLYWAGTVEVPENGETNFSWESANDTSKTDGALLASGDPTKTFNVEGDEISYEVTALGTTVTVRLGRE